MLWSGSEELHADEYLGAKITFFFSFFKSYFMEISGNESYCSVQTPCSVP